MTKVPREHLRGVDLPSCRFRDGAHRIVLRHLHHEAVPRTCRWSRKARGACVAVVFACDDAQKTAGAHDLAFTELGAGGFRMTNFLESRSVACSAAAVSARKSVSGIQRRLQVGPYRRRPGSNRPASLRRARFQLRADRRPLCTKATQIAAPECRGLCHTSQILRLAAVAPTLSLATLLERGDGLDPDIARARPGRTSTVSRALARQPLSSMRRPALIQKIAAEEDTRSAPSPGSLVTSPRPTRSASSSPASPTRSWATSSAASRENRAGAAAALSSSRPAIATPTARCAPCDTSQERHVNGILVCPPPQVSTLYMGPARRKYRPRSSLSTTEHAGGSSTTVSVDSPTGAPADHDASRFSSGISDILIWASLRPAFGRGALLPDYRKVSRRRHPVRSAAVINSDSGADDASPRHEQLLDLAQPPIAVFCYNDMRLMGHRAAGTWPGCRRTCSIAGSTIFLSSPDPP